MPLDPDRAAASADMPGPGGEDVAPAKGSMLSLYPFRAACVNPLLTGVPRKSGVLLYCEWIGDSANLAVEAALDGLCPYDRPRFEPGDEPLRLWPSIGRARADGEEPEVGVDIMLIFSCERVLG